MNLNPPIAVVDVFNTLVRNTIRNAPYKALYKQLEEKQEMPFKSREFFNRAMLFNGYIEDFIKSENLIYDNEMIKKFKNSIKEELESIIFNTKLIKDLNENYEKIILLSNLSKEYTPPINELKTKLNNIKGIILSYEVSTLKPEIDIFRLAAKAANKEPHNCVMYGDNKKLDIDSALISGYKKAILVEKWWVD